MTNLPSAATINRLYGSLEFLVGLTRSLEEGIGSVSDGGRGRGERLDGLDECVGRGRTSSLP
jgi:hypothetical protein